MGQYTRDIFVKDATYSYDILEVNLLLFERLFTTPSTSSVKLSDYSDYFTFNLSILLTYFSAIKLI